MAIKIMEIDMGQKTASKESEVDSQLCLLEKEQEETVKVVGHLEQLLSDVLRKEVTEAGEDSPEQELTPLATRIRCNFRKQMAINNIISSIVKKLEL